MSEVKVGGDRPSIRDSVREALNNLGDRTRSAVIEHYAEKEAEKKATALIKGLDKLSEAENTLRRMKPDVETFNEDGSPASAAYSKAKLEERKKLAEQVEKLTDAINKADEGDFDKLYKLVN